MGDVGPYRKSRVNHYRGKPMNKWKLSTLLAVGTSIGILVFSGVPARAQLTDTTQAPNTINAGIRKSVTCPGQKPGRRCRTGRLPTLISRRRSSRACAASDLARRRIQYENPLA